MFTHYLNNTRKLGHPPLYSSNKESFEWMTIVYRLNEWQVLVNLIPTIPQNYLLYQVNYPAYWKVNLGNRKRPDGAAHPSSRTDYQMRNREYIEKHYEYDAEIGNLNCSFQSFCMSQTTVKFIDFALEKLYLHFMKSHIIIICIKVLNTVVVT